MIAKELSTFAAIGVFCAVLDTGLMQLLIWLGTNYFISTTLSFFFGFIVNFYLHTRITFRSTYTHSTLVRFMLVVLINYIITLIIVHIFQIMMTMPLLGKLISLPIVAINGFLLSKKWVYK